MNFGHILTAMVTPFDQNGLIDVEKTKELIDYLIANGTDAIVVAGTTGESPTLSNKEKLDLFKLCVEHVNKRVPIIAGTGSNNTSASIDMTKKATDIGVDGIMVVVPYYNKPSQEGMFQHFKKIAESTKLPVMLYNVPGRTGAQLEPKTTIALSKIKNIVSIKEASGNLEQMAKIITETASDFYLYTGDDANTLPTLSIGGHGVVSVGSHIIGSQMQDMISDFYNGDVKEAALKHRALLPVMNAMFLAPNPTCVKYALNKLGIEVGGVRLPLVSLTNDVKKQIKNTLSSLKS
ncbi:4-hydroxy-tetrahydrodipicolinate synthase [Halalkalibacter akibai]|uniref:4-hydroxy-tetrahydrodipicolinate synthase n=1 Tax=Halalkalibacter akibai (strain ATCC 43226 / DSM 21942 / CIP 109018 / JCM 9157 / 1139) TaxID=1236973 RepID=W4QVH1_HALA3|nr:4-hydroxy-tetrahydrodipicolinate synthase [Halalkalibacter akibai]GAE36086.1 dihydrodipicolinate synthase [Halalkalibacter akibai JCM 9157]